MSTETDLKRAEDALFRANMARDPNRGALLATVEELRTRFTREVNGKWSALTPAAAVAAPTVGHATAAKCLTVRQPFASLIMAGVKRVENRSWNVRYRGLLYIHAAKSRPPGKDWSDVLPRGLARDWHRLPDFASLPCGAVLGTVELAGCLHESDLDARFAADPFAGGPFVWLLDNPKLLAVPFPAKGSLGLWTPPVGLLLN